MDTDSFEGEKLAVLAREWRLSEEEIAEIDVQNEGEEASPDGLVYSLLFRVDVNGPWRVLRKIPDLDDDGIVRVRTSAFDVADQDIE
nr:hypothetical protein [uncultured Shinella sp.]